MHTRILYIIETYKLKIVMVTQRELLFCDFHLQLETNHKSLQQLNLPLFV
jgi:glutamine amidotransferase PdxT